MLSAPIGKALPCLLNSSAAMINMPCLVFSRRVVEEANGQHVAQRTLQAISAWAEEISEYQKVNAWVKEISEYQKVKKDIMMDAKF